MKFSQSGERLRHELASYLLHVRPSVRPRTARGGRIRLGGGRNEAGRRRGRQKPWKTLNSGLEALQPLEIPQNRQSFLWKSLEKTDGDLEKLGEKAWTPPLFYRFRPSGGVARAGRELQPGRTCKGPAAAARSRMRTVPHRAAAGCTPCRRHAKFSRLQSLEKSQNGESLCRLAGNGPPPPPRENDVRTVRGWAVTSRPVPGSRARRGRA